MDIAIQVVLFLTVSFWAYCNLFYKIHALPYASGYLIFAVFQWILLAVNLVRIYGFLIGGIAFVVLFAFGAVLITNFTTNQIYRFMFKNNPLPPLALFSVFVWISAGFTVLGFLLR